MRKVTRPHVVEKQRLCDLDLPEQVTLSLVDLAASAKEHLLSLSVGLGLATLQELLADELRRIVGPKGKHDPARAAYRHGSGQGSVTLGGRLVHVARPRARTCDGREVELAAYRAARDRDLLTAAALEKMLAELASRRYAAGLEPVGAAVRTRGTSRSAVSRRFVAGTAAKLAGLLARDLSAFSLRALFLRTARSGNCSMCCWRSSTEGSIEYAFYI